MFSKQKKRSLKKRSANSVFDYVSSNGSMKVVKTNVTTSHGDLNADEKNSFYLGRHHIRNGDRNQRYRRVADPGIEFYHRNKVLFDDFEVNLDSALVVNGCFKSNKGTIQKTMIPETDSHFSRLPSMSLIKEKSSSIKAVIRKLNIPQFIKAEENDMFASSFNLTTYPGFSYKEYLGQETKQEALEDALLVAKERWRNIESANRDGRCVVRKELFPNTFAVGARNKRELNNEDGESINSRAVHMPEFHSELNSSAWIDPISDYIKYSEKGCIYIGNSFNKFQRLKTDLEGAGSIIEGDVRRFDSSLYITDIIIAVALSRLFYDINDESIDNHFIAMFDTIGIKDYYTPGGFIYRLVHGLPSGIKSTSLYGSLINLINLNHCTKFIDSKTKKFIVGGDDFLVVFRDRINNDCIDKMQEIAAEIGIEFKFLIEKRMNAPNFDDRPTFYKYTIDRGEPVVPTAALLERVFIPWSKKYDSNFKILQHLFDLLPSLAAPRSHCLLFYEFFKKMYKLVTKRSILIEEVYVLHLASYNAVMRGEFVETSKEEQVCRTILNSIDLDSLSSKEFPKLFEKGVLENEHLYPMFVVKGKKIADL